jgi:UDP-N-acetylmuramyl pentapeptide phosphotransferase/UDP-N-acetylglucosamine-1-phosphate transferase
MTLRNQKIIFAGLLVPGVIISVLLNFVTSYHFIWMYSLLILLLLAEDSFARKLKKHHLSDKWVSAIVVALFAMQFSIKNELESITMWTIGVIVYMGYVLISMMIEGCENNEDPK